MNELSKTPHVIAVTGGKGGVGKTSIAINLAIALSRTGSKVCLFDGDTSLANTNVMLGLYPAYTLEHLFTGERSIQEIVINGPEGIQIVPGASGVAHCVELDVGQQQRLVTSIRSIEKHYDYLIVDTAAGIGPTVLHFIAASQVAVVVITPEPTSLTDAFSLLKVLKRRGYRRKVQVVVNMVPNPSLAKKAYSRFSQAVDKYLSLRTEYLGSVWMDESMRNAVTTQRPVALFPKTDPSARCFYRMAEAIEYLFEQPSTPKLAFSEYWQKVVENQHRKRVKIHALTKPDLASIKHESETPKLEPLTQVQKQLRAKLEEAKAISETKLEHSNKRKEDVLAEEIKVESEDYVPYPPINKSNRPLQAGTKILDDSSEKTWLDLRLRMNQFMSDANTTPEQVVTLFSSAIFAFGDRLGGATIDLLHGLFGSLDPESLTDEQKQLLLNDFERMGIDAYKKQQDTQNNKASYDSQGFGDQQALVQAIRSSSTDLPLESLLESIKYASLVDSSAK